MIRTIRATHFTNNLQLYIPLISPASQFTCISVPPKNASHRGKQEKNMLFIRKMPSASCTTKVLNSTPEVGLLKKVLTKVRFAGHEKARLKVAAYYMFESIADKINYLDFFNEFDLPNTFNSWFLVTELHVWMIMLRAMAEGSEKGQDGRILRNNIVEAMWADVNTRAKKLGAHNPSGTRMQIEMLSEQFQAALIAYDEGVMSDDKVLAAALWRRFFERDCRDYTKLEKLVLYVRKHVQLLDKLSREDFVHKPKIAWLPLADIKH